MRRRKNGEGEGKSVVTMVTQGAICKVVNTAIAHP